MSPGRPSALHIGDNLHWLTNHEHFPDQSVDLVYLDPPFNSQEEYNVIYQERPGVPSTAQVAAFDDTWKWTPEVEESYLRLTASPLTPEGTALKVLSGLLGKVDLMAYLVMMAPRLAELKRVLKPTGSLYLHCDPRASHYLKVLLDVIFGLRNFRREIIWRTGWVSGFKSKANNWVRNHDVLLYYVRDPNAAFNFRKLFTPHPPGYTRRGGGGNPKGVPMDDVWQDVLDQRERELLPALFNKVFTKRDVHAQKRLYDLWLKSFSAVGDVWDENKLYSPWIKSFSKEKLGYPTQKPVTLLKRILEASSKPGDLILDPFCGCGTAIEAAEELGRRWKGIDLTIKALGPIEGRLEARWGRAVQDRYEVFGAPTTLAEATALAERDKYQFQWWAFGTLRGRGLESSERKKGADEGIDGRILFEEPPDNEVKQVIVQVKGGQASAKDVRDLAGVLEQEGKHGAVIGCLVAFAFTEPMRTWAKKAGEYRPAAISQKFPRLQLVTVEQLVTERAQAVKYFGRNVSWATVAAAERKAAQTEFFSAAGV